MCGEQVRKVFKKLEKVEADLRQKALARPDAKPRKSKWNGSKRRQDLIGEVKELMKKRPELANELTDLGGDDALWVEVLDPSPPVSCAPAMRL